MHYRCRGSTWVFCRDLSSPLDLFGPSTRSSLQEISECFRLHNNNLINVSSYSIAGPERPHYWIYNRHYPINRAFGLVEIKSSWAEEIGFYYTTSSSSFCSLLAHFIHDCAFVSLSFLCCVFLVFFFSCEWTRWMNFHRPGYRVFSVSRPGNHWCFVARNEDTNEWLSE